MIKNYDITLELYRNSPYNTMFKYYKDDKKVYPLTIELLDKEDKPIPLILGSTPQYFINDSTKGLSLDIISYDIGILLINIDSSNFDTIGKNSITVKVQNSAQMLTFPSFVIEISSSEATDTNSNDGQVKMDKDDTLDYLDTKIDNKTITVNTDNKLVAIGGIDNDGQVKVNKDDQLGYLEAKVDQTTIKINEAGKLEALGGAGQGDVVSVNKIKPDSQGDVSLSPHDIDAYSEAEIDTKINSLNNNIGKVKFDTQDTLDFLNTKIDNDTLIINLNNKLIAVKLKGQTITIDELNSLAGIKGNVQTQIDSMSSVLNLLSPPFNTLAELLAYPNPQNRDAAIVLNDESENNETTLYIYGTQWAYVLSLGTDVSVVSPSSINGYIIINGVETKVYDDSFDVKSVNKLTPDNEGNINLQASDIDAYNEQEIDAKLSAIESQISDIPVADNIVLNDVTGQYVTGNFTFKNGIIYITNSQGQTIAKIYTKQTLNTDNISVNTLQIEVNGSSGEISQYSLDDLGSMTINNKGVIVDGVLYSNAEIDNKVNSKAALQHTHMGSDITSPVSEATILTGQTVTINEINYLGGATSNIQQQINSLTNVFNLIGSFPTYADLLNYTGAKEKDMAFVNNDETHNNELTMYIYTTEWDYLASLGVDASVVESSAINGHIIIDGVDTIVYDDKDVEKLINKGKANGYASLDINGLIPKIQLPLNETNYLGNFVDLPTLVTAYPSPEKGDYAFIEQSFTIWYFDSNLSAWINSQKASFAPYDSFDSHTKDESLHKTAEDVANLGKASYLATSGDGSKYLADDGLYHEVSVPDMANSPSSLIIADDASNKLSKLGDFNTLIGEHSGNVVGSTTGAKNNTGIGYSTLYHVTSGTYNVAMGVNSLMMLNVGSYNTAVGVGTGYAINMGNYNCLFGYNCGYDLTNGSDNVFMGSYAGSSITTGKYNVAVGEAALQNDTTSMENVALGFQALGFSVNSHSQCTGIGYQADTTTSGLTNATALGYMAKVGASNSVQFGNTAITACYWGNGTSSAFSVKSDERIKEEITDADNDKCYNLIKSLNLHRFKYKDFVKDSGDIHKLGFLAQEFEELLPHAVITKDQTFCHENTEGKNTRTTIKGCKSIDTSQLIPILVGTVQSLMEKVEALEDIIKSQKE